MNKLIVDAALRISDSMMKMGRCPYTPAECRELAETALLDTMRENEQLKAYPLKMICEKCNVLTDVDLPKHTETEEETLKRKMQKFALPHPSKT